MKSIFKAVIVRVITLEAQAVLRKYKPKVVGITGSVGKTSTKDAIYEVLVLRHGEDASLRIFSTRRKERRSSNVITSGEKTGRFYDETLGELQLEK